MLSEKIGKIYLSFPFPQYCDPLWSEEKPSHAKIEKESVWMLVFQFSENSFFNTAWYYAEVPELLLFRDSGISISDNMAYQVSGVTLLVKKIYSS